MLNVFWLTIYVILQFYLFVLHMKNIHKHGIAKFDHKKWYLTHTHTHIYIYIYIYIYICTSQNIYKKIY